MNVSLTPELEELVNRKVASGMYHTASEVVRDGLRLLQERDELREHRLEALRREIAIGLEQLAKGQYTTFDKSLVEDIKARGRERLANKAEKGQK